MSSSAIINKSLRKHLIPVLRDAGFEKIDARNAWSWSKECVWVFNIRAVGNYFSSVTGWPPASVGASLGVHYSFIPTLQNLKVDNAGRLLPAEHQCHMRSHLERNLPQQHQVSSLSNPAEQSRKDIWWLEQDGSNADEVARDIAGCFEAIGVAWYSKYNQFNLALAEVEKERDCFNKFVLATYLARELGQPDVANKYATLAEKEGQRIGRLPDKTEWFALAGR